MNRLLFSSLLLTIFSCKNDTINNYDLAITNANVVHLETGKIEVQDIYISDGKIQAVEAASSSNFKGDSTIDASGKYVLPGFWDNHIH